jgi:hypothetical protein
VAGVPLPNLVYGMAEGAERGVQAWVSGEYG